MNSKLLNLDQIFLLTYWRGLSQFVFSYIVIAKFQSNENYDNKKSN